MKVRDLIKERIEALKAEQKDIIHEYSNTLDGCERDVYSMAHVRISMEIVFLNELNEELSKN